MRGADRLECKQRMNLSWSSDSQKFRRHFFLPAVAAIDQPQLITPPLKAEHKKSLAFQCRNPQDIQIICLCRFLSLLPQQRGLQIVTSA